MMHWFKSGSILRCIVSAEKARATGLLVLILRALLFLNVCVAALPLLMPSEVFASDYVMVGVLTLTIFVLLLFVRRGAVSLSSIILVVLFLSLVTFSAWCGNGIYGSAFPPVQLHMWLVLGVALVASTLLLRFVAGRILVQHETEQVLREREQLFRTLVESQGEGVGIVNEQETFTLANPAAEQIFGVSRGELVGRNLSEFLDAEQFVYIQAQTAKRRSGEHSSYEVEIVRPDGEKRNLLVTATSQFDAHGQFVGTFGVFRDITERVQMQKALAESERRYQSLFENSPDAIFVEDFEGNVLDVNPAACQLHQISREALVGKNARDLMSQDFVQSIPSVYAGDGSGQSLREGFCWTKDGRKIPIEIRTNVVDYAGEQALLLHVRDITERVGNEAVRREAEVALRRSAERLEIQHEIDRAILIAQSPELMALAVLARLHRLVPCLVFGVNIFDLETQQAHTLVMYAEGRRVPVLESSVPLDVFDVRTLARGLIQEVGDMSQELDLLPVYQFLYDRGMRSYIHVPLIVQGELIGTLNLGAREENLFDHTCIEIAREVAASLAVAIHQARLYEQIQQDAVLRSELLREVNHRVGNNLMSIVGLLHAEQRFALQRASAAREEIENILERLIRRVNGMVEVHRTLSDASWAPVRLSELALQLINFAVSALPITQFMKIDVVPSDIKVSPRQANHLALIISELATNTVKYAMAERVRGAIHVRIRREKDLVLFEYCDDGPGYPQAVLDEVESGVGLYLIHRFATLALRGTLSLSNEQGAVARIRFMLERTSEK